MQTCVTFKPANGMGPYRTGRKERMEKVGSCEEYIAPKKTARMGVSPLITAGAAPYTGKSRNYKKDRDDEGGMMAIGTRRSVMVTLAGAAPCGNERRGYEENRGEVSRGPRWAASTEAP